MKSSQTNLCRLGVGLFLVLTACKVPAADDPGRKQRPLPKVADSVVVERDVEYGRAGDQLLFLDVVRPKQDHD